MSRAQRESSPRGGDTLEGWGKQGTMEGEGGWYEVQCCAATGQAGAVSGSLMDLGRENGVEDPVPGRARYAASAAKRKFSKTLWRAPVSVLLLCLSPLLRVLAQVPPSGAGSTACMLDPDS